MNSQDFILMHSNVEYSSIIHEYDPQKAHEYYLRTRQLKGKTLGNAPVSLYNVGGTSTKAPSKTTVIKTAPKTPPSKSVIAAKRRLETKARIEALKTRAEKLRKLLKTLVDEAKIRAGKDPNEKAAPSASKKTTTAQDKEAAKRSKDYYEKNKEKIKKEKTLTEQEKSLQETIKNLNKKIADARQEVRDHITVARSKAVKRNS